MMPFLGPYSATSQLRLLTCSTLPLYMQINKPNTDMSSFLNDTIAIYRSGGDSEKEVTLVKTKLRTICDTLCECDISGLIDFVVHTATIMRNELKEFQNWHEYDLHCVLYYIEDILSFTMATHPTNAGWTVTTGDEVVFKQDLRIHEIGLQLHIIFSTIAAYVPYAVRTKNLWCYSCGENTFRVSALAPARGTPAGHNFYTMKSSFFIPNVDYIEYTTPLRKNIFGQ